jgi:hypothetical protein
LAGYGDCALIKAQLDIVAPKSAFPSVIRIGKMLVSEFVLTSFPLSALFPWLPVALEALVGKAKRFAPVDRFL